MEIIALGSEGVRLKGKQAVFSVNATDKAANGTFLFAPAMQAVIDNEDSIVLSGPGDYELRGVKITGIRGGDTTVYSMILDGVSIAVGNLQAIQSLQTKLKEQNIIIAYCTTEENASFLTSLASNALVFYGPKAATVNQVFPKEKSQTIAKYQTTLEKLPLEMETIVLE
ncbi:MAG: hypothetical protein AAB553_03435 [Patescibacteria group bacterium]